MIGSYAILFFNLKKNKTKKNRIFLFLRRLKKKKKKKKEDISMCALLIYDMIPRYNCFIAMD